eukprot:scaffold21680_cov14-Tisochrysis_lutea.AAC.2
MSLSGLIPEVCTRCALAAHGLHDTPRPFCCFASICCLQDRSLKRAQDVRKQLMAIMDRYKLELVSAGRRYDRICKAARPAQHFAASLCQELPPYVRNSTGDGGCSQ